MYRSLAVIRKFQANNNKREETKKKLKKSLHKCICECKVLDIGSLVRMIERIKNKDEAQPSIAQTKLENEHSMLNRNKF